MPHQQSMMYYFITSFHTSRYAYVDVCIVIMSSSHNTKIISRVHALTYSGVVPVPVPMPVPVPVPVPVSVSVSVTLCARNQLRAGLVTDPDNVDLQQCLQALKFSRKTLRLPSFQQTQRRRTDTETHRYREADSVLMSM